MLIEASTFQQIEDAPDAFCRFFGEYASHVLNEARLFPRLSRLRLEEIHGAWRNDLTRVGKHEPLLDHGLDHFKRSGHLAFWVRRFGPVVEAEDLTQNLADSEGYPVSPDEKAFRDLLFGYINEYLAFDLGLQFCRFYETGKPGGSRRAELLRLDEDYIRMICHFMKYKTVSPHAMTMIYKSLFYGPSGAVAAPSSPS